MRQVKPVPVVVIGGYQASGWGLRRVYSRPSSAGWWPFSCTAVGI